ncbi:hypothetical protein ACE6H2_020865 [Prunus campanulata]
MKDRSWFYMKERKGFGTAISIFLVFKCKNIQTAKEWSYGLADGKFAFVVKSKYRGCKF